MAKVLRFFISMFFILFILAFVVIFIAVKFVNLNEFKTQISQQIYNATGKQLQLNGDIHWSFFPWLSIHVNDAVVQNDPSFGPQNLASIKQADVAIKLLPLFDHKVEINTINLDGMDLNLITAQNGKHNWDTKNTATKSTPTTSTNNDDSKAKNNLDLNIGSISISNSNVHLINQATKQTININNINLNSQQISLLQSFPFKGSFTVQSAAPAIDADIKIQTQIALDLPHQIYQLNDLAITSNIRKPNAIPVKLLTDLKIDNKQQIIYLQNIVADAANFHVTGNISGKEMANSMAWQGKLQTPQLQYNKLNASNVTLQFISQNQIVKLNPITANVYQGNFKGSITFNNQSATPQISSNLQLQNIQAGPLFKDLANVTKIQISGTGNINAQLTTQGNSSSALTQNLDGQGNFSLNNGILHGIDIPFWVNTGKLLLNKQIPTTLSNNNSSTSFGNLTGTFKINNGVVSNNDLLLQATTFRATGSGQANLNTQNLNYVLNTQLVNTGNNSPQGVVIPIKISGPFAHLSIQPDTNALIKSTLKDQYVKNKDKINNAINKFLGNDAGKKVQEQLNSLFK